MHPSGPGRRPAIFNGRVVPAALSLALSLAAHSAAQTIAPPPPKPAAEQEPVVLTPFTVGPESNQGYLAGSSLTGSRMATDILDIAAPTTAFTEQFFIDLGAFTMADMSQYMVSTEFDYGESSGVQNVINEDGRALRIRGLLAQTVTTNFFKTSVNNVRWDMFSMDRLDQTRGPNSVLFGLGSAGGIQNLSPKQAQLGARSLRVTLAGRSYHGMREELDVNIPLLKDRLGVRFAAVNENRGSWRHHEYSDEQRVFGTVKWQPTAATQLNLEMEKGHIDKGTRRTYTAKDAYTPWRDAGRNLSATASPALGVQILSNNAYAVLDTATGAIQNWRGKTTSARKTTVDGQNVALADFSVLPKEVSILGPGFLQPTDYLRRTLTVAHAFAKNFNAEFAAFRMDQTRVLIDSPDATTLFLNADPNPALPDGRPNPNAGRAYLETLPQISNRFYRDQALRLSAAYDLDLGRWGRHRLAAVGQYADSNSYLDATREVVINDPYNPAPENLQNSVWRRTYVDLAGPARNIVFADWSRQDINGLPIAGSATAPGKGAIRTRLIPFNAATQIVSNYGWSEIAMLQSKFFGGRLTTTIGGSHDELTNYFSTQGRTAPLPGFTTGFITVIPGAVPNRTTAENVSFSAVCHVTKWLSVLYNQAENTAVPRFSGSLHSATGRPPPPRGRNLDAGLKLNLLDRRLYVTATYFETSAERDFDAGGVHAADVNPIWNALDAAGVLARNGLLLGNVLDTTTGSTFDGIARGVELEATANLTARWRLFANFSHTDVKRANIGREMTAYLAAQRPFWEANGSVRLVSAVGGATTVGQYLGVLDQRAYNEFVLADGRRAAGQIPDKANLRTTYEFAAGPLDGFSLGGGGRWLGRGVLSYDSARDASGRVVTTQRHGPEQFLADLNLAYRGKAGLLRRDVRWSVQLNVNNVFDNRDFVPLSMSRAGELILYRFNPPREWLITTRFNF